RDRRGPRAGAAHVGAHRAGAAGVRQGRADRAGERLRALRPGARVRTHRAADAGDRAPEARDRDAPRDARLRALALTSRRLMLAERYDCILFDLDGVLYRGEDAVPSAPPTLAELRRQDVAPVFLTTHSARTPPQVAEKLRGIGIEAEPGEVVTSALATAELLAGRGGGRAFVIGQDGVREALTDAGIAILDGEPEEADLVVVGYDGAATYGSLKRASLLVQRGARLVATHADGSYPGAGGRAPCWRPSPLRPAPSPRSWASRSPRCSRPVAVEAGVGDRWSSGTGWTPPSGGGGGWGGGGGAGA